MQTVFIPVNSKDARLYLSWTLWALMNIIAFIFGVLCFVTAGNLHRFSNDHYSHDAEPHSMIIVSCFTATVVMLFIFVSFFMNRRLSTTTLFPSTLDFVLLSSFVHMFLISLLCAVVLHKGRGKFGEGYDYYHGHWWYYDEWSSSDARVFNATYTMGYITAAIYLASALLFGCLAFLFRSVSENEIEVGVSSNVRTYQPTTLMPLDV
eukprot:g6655.t1